MTTFARAGTVAFVMFAMVSVSAAQTNADEKLACVDAASRGQNERDAGHLLEARRQLLVCARDVCPSIVRKSCAEWLGELRERIPSIVLRVVDDSNRDVIDVQANLDGAPIALNGRPIPLDPGPHQLSIVASDGDAIERVVLAVERQIARIVNIELNKKLAAKPTKPTPSLAGPAFSIPNGAWVLGGVTLVGAAAFAYFGTVARHDLERLKRDCAPDCLDSQTQIGRTKALVADASFGIAAAALVSAVTWTLLAQPERSHASVQASVTPARGGVLCSIASSF